ncbi:MAG: hypothetical protein KDB37_00160 [Ilumatobacter sp.]|nr:hypothetical protein [Ilumatobacter sp.]
MLYEALAGDDHTSQSSAFWWRLTDNLFRRLTWFLLPILLLAGLGMYRAATTTDLYRSSGTLSATSNPLLPEQQVSGVSAQFLESPAAANARIINERLRTDSFINGVADRAGLGDAVESGEVQIDVLRGNVWASANGDSILNVNATWADGQTSFQLAVATIDEYEAYLNDTVVSATREAEEFYNAQLVKREQERDDAIEELEAFVDTLDPVPLGEDQPVGVQIEIDRLADAVTTAEAAVDATEAQIDAAALTQSQQMSEAGRSLTTIDEPQVPSAPETSLVQRASTVIAFALLGTVIALAALITTTVLSTAVASPADLLGIEGVELVATVGDKSFGRQRRRRRAGATT